jgi:hypothetical protein
MSERDSQPTSFTSKKRLAEMAEYMEACALIARNGADIHNGSKELREHADMVTAIASYLSSAVETDWKHRAEEAERILQDNMALANRTTRRTMDERNGIIRKLRERYSAIEIADMVGLTRQRVHQILNEAPVEGSVHGSPAERPAHPDPTGTTREPPHCPTCACGAPETTSGPDKRDDELLRQAVLLLQNDRYEVMQWARGVKLHFPDGSPELVAESPLKASEPQCICATTAEPLRLVDPQCPKHSTRS